VEARVPHKFGGEVVQQNNTLVLVYLSLQARAKWSAQVLDFCLAKHGAERVNGPLL
jgi:hypothetical protein